MTRQVLSRSLLVRFALPVALLVSAFAAVLPAHAAGPQIGGKVTSETGTAAPTSFTFLRHNGLTATIEVSSTTVVTRRYGAKTDISGINIGDTLSIWGSFQSGTSVFDATRITDKSIQSADAYSRGVVLSVDTAANSFQLRVTNTALGSPLAHRLTVDLAPNQAIPLPDGTTTTLAGLQVGDTLFVRGIYDRASATLDRLDAIRVLKIVSTIPAPPVNLKIVGFAFMKQHFALIRIHTAPGASITVGLSLGTLSLTINGTANKYGNFQSQRVVGNGTWPSTHHLRATVTVTLNGGSRKVAAGSWIP